MHVFRVPVAGRARAGVAVSTLTMGALVLAAPLGAAPLASPAATASPPDHTAPPAPPAAAASVEVLDSVVAPGAQVWVRGAGFAAKERVRVEIAGGRAGGLLDGRIVTDATGLASGQVTVPAKNPAGVMITDLPQPVTVRLVGETSQRTATGSLRVKEMWATGDYSPLGNAVNPVEDTLTRANVDQLVATQTIQIDEWVGRVLAIRDQRVYLSVGDLTAGRVVAYDLVTREELWSTPTHGLNGHTIAVSGDGEWVYQQGGYSVAGLDAHTGELRWEIGTVANWGAPRIVGDLLIVNRGHTEDKQYTTALDRFTGEIVWDKTQDPTPYYKSLAGVTLADGIVYQPLQTVENGGNDTLRIDTGTRVRAAQLTKGGVIADGYPGTTLQTDTWSTAYNSLTLFGAYNKRSKRWTLYWDDLRKGVRPTLNHVIDRDTLYVASTHSLRSPAKMIAVDLRSNKILWRAPQIGGYLYAGMVYANGVIYAAARGTTDNTDGEPPYVFTATDAATGKRLWTSDPLPDNQIFEGIPAVLDGHLYTLSSSTTSTQHWLRTYTLPGTLR